MSEQADDPGMCMEWVSSNDTTVEHEDDALYLRADDVTYLVKQILDGADPQSVLDFLHALENTAIANTANVFVDGKFMTASDYANKLAKKAEQS